ncbi:YTH domain-containing protein 1-like [Metopolophium dirhodum]|uniref:YTH domain-containing protein 1-like n=1 Tax=Metopolophium dirhodum TaxID=44670 RepID=UPI00299026AE|nr:YTH domain-containing protein 1-like [Metopolophium dirhodum]
MVPSSIQWTMTPSVNILVYPISRYVISPVIKSPGTTIRRRSQRHTSTSGRTSFNVRRCSESRARRSLSDNCGNRQHRRSQKYRRLQTYPPKRSPYRRRNGCSKSRYDKRSGSRDTYSSGLRSVTHHRDKQAPQDRKQEQDKDVDVESDEDEEDKELEAEVEVEDCDYDGDDDNINDDDDYDEDDDDDDDDDNDQVVDDGYEYEEQLEFGKEEHKRSDDATITYGWGPQPPVGETQSRVMRRSANIVLLAHGNRSLYVLTIQRNQVTSVSFSSDRYRNRCSSSTTVISYKLPGGQFILTDDEQHNCQGGRNILCTCPDDQQWYSAAINHFMTNFTTRGPTTSATTGQAVGDRPQFMPLGNWYRTQQDNDSETILASGGVKYDHHWRGNCNYYPYKPAHVSRQLAGHKRVYAVPDACCLFPGEEHTFQLKTPHAKTKTATTKTKTTTVTVTTTYKCKFVPLARLHENSRLYGPILSSLPAVLSGMNLICSP